MHEQVNDKAVSLSIRVSELTARKLAEAMRAYLIKSRDPTAKRGYQSLNSLTKQGASLESAEVSGDNIGSFKRIARKYNVDFALRKDTSVTPPSWIVFFKAKDSKSLELAFNDYSKLILKGKSLKPSLRDRLDKFKELAETVLAPVKNRNRGGHEL